MCPPSILVCEEVYVFLTPVHIYNFLKRHGGIRNVLMQTDANGNTPIFYAIENLTFQGNDVKVLKNRALFKYMITGKGLLSLSFGYDITPSISIGLSRHLSAAAG